MNPIIELINLLESHAEWDGYKHLSRNDILIKEGDRITDFFLIEEGTIRIFVLAEKEEHTIRFGYAGEMICALDSFFTDQPTGFCIQAMKKIKLKRISKKKFYTVIDSSNTTKQLWREVLGNFICQQIEREKDLLISSPSERYKKVFSRSPHLFQEVPHKYIASYLRMTPETLSRIRKS